MAITLNNVVGNFMPLYKGIYAKRPVWGVYSAPYSSAPSSGQGFFYTFGENNPFVFQSMDMMPGSSQANTGFGRARLSSTQDEVVVSGYYWAPNTGTQTTSESFSPSSGYTGAPYVCQTGTMCHFNAFDNGNWGNQRSTNNFKLHRHAGVIVGESSWNQTYGFCAYNGKFTKVPLGTYDNLITTPATSNDFFFANADMRTGTQWGVTSGVGLGIGDATLTSAGTTNYNNASAFRNNGMLCHNRNSGKMVYLEGTTTTGQYKLHVIDLQNKIGDKTTTAQILAWINAAVAAGTSRYNVYTITLPSWSNAYTTGNIMQQLKPILCDDGTMWIVGWDHSNGGAGTLRLYKCVDTSAYATWTQVSTLTQTTTYDCDSGDMYGIRHMNSDDNSRVAVYVPYYYYHGGLHSFIVDTKTAVANGSDVKWCQYAQSDSYGGHYIVPSGGPDFVVHQSYNNADGGAGANWQVLRLPILAGDSKSYAATINYQPTWNQSTSYQGWLPVKIMPTEEWKPVY